MFSSNDWQSSPPWSVEGGTWFSWTEEPSLPVPLLGELALRVYRPFMARLMRAALDELRTSSRP